MSYDVLEHLRAYLLARGVAGPHDLRAKRTELLPGLRTSAPALRSRADLTAAVALLEDAADAAIAGPNPEDVALRDELRGRLEALLKDAPPALAVPIVLVDEGADGAVVDELAVEILKTPGQGRIWTAQPVEDDARAAAVHGVQAATALLRRLGYAAEPHDLDVAWSTGLTKAAIEGPSLGLAIALAVLARGTNTPLPGDVAVTGAVGVDGRVGPVRGLAAKAAAVEGAGFKRLLVPGGGAALEGDRSLSVIEVETLDAATAEVLGLRAPALRTPKLRLSDTLLATALVLATFLGLFDLFAVAAYPSIHQALPTASISDRVVLVTWDRTNGTGAAGADGVDFTTFADHRSYRATHPAVLRAVGGAGARAVALDAWISGGDQDATGAIAQAIFEVKTAGTDVFLPARAPGDVWDPPDARLVAASTAIGFASARGEGPTRLVRGARIADRTQTAGHPPWSLALLLAAADREAEPRWTGARAAGAGDLVLAVGEHGDRWFPWPNQPAFRRYAYADIHAGRFDPAHLEDKLVLIGSAQGDGDRHHTPVGDWWGVEVQAAITESLLDDERIEPFAPLDRAGFVGLIALVLAIALDPRRSGRRPRTRAAVALLTCASLAVVISSIAWGTGKYLPWTDAWVAVFAFAAVAGWRMRAQKRGLEVH
ncbi:MAG: CHASE2 domain-containing protein [Proteobacteria bacterium]|nr:CHASE2 domain-containing protein [Pseudomonadota bacterium]